MHDLDQDLGFNEAHTILTAACRAAQTWSDAWTVVTADGKLAAQYEHTILITKDGHEVLTVA